MSDTEQPEKSPEPVDPLHHLRTPHEVVTCEHGISVHIPCKRCKDNYDKAFKIDKEEADIEKQSIEDWT